MAKAAKPADDNQPKASHIASQRFRDVNNFDKVYEVDDDVSHLDEQTLERLIGLEVVKKKND